MWQWWNFLEGALPPGRKVLRLNVDETACRLYYKPRKGDLADASIATALKDGRLVQNVDAGRQKAALSHMALLCDSSALQPHMPQFILGNEHVLSKAVVESLSPTIPGNVHVLRRKSSWVTHDTMTEWARALSKSLAPHLKEFQPILLLDACQVHYGRRFLKALQRGKIWVVFVPAGTTWLLQPCDTHLFAKYKAFLRDRQHGRLLNTEVTGDVDAAHALDDIILGIRRVIQGTKWAPAFDANGYGEEQRNVRARIKKELDCDSVSGVPSALPELSDLETIFPRGRTPDISLLFNGVRAARRGPEPRAEPIAATPPSSPDNADAPFVSPWRGRLRSTSRVSLADTLAPDLDPPLPPPAAPPAPCLPPLPPASAAGRLPPRLPVGRPLPRPRPMQHPARPPLAP